MVTANATSGDEEAAYGELRAMVLDRSSGVQAIGDLLDRLTDDLRSSVVRRLGPKEQCELYEKAAGFRRVTLTDLVPAHVTDFAEVRHLGRNTLPAFRIFEKRFCRLPGESAEEPSELAGYNHQAMAVMTGPGYFIAREDPPRGEVLVDYGRLPGQRPEGWPEIQSNERGLSRFVYGFMVDTLRRVSEHVTVGSAARKGRDMGSYFVLSREG